MSVAGTDTLAHATQLLHDLQPKSNDCAGLDCANAYGKLRRTATLLITLALACANYTNPASTAPQIMHHVLA